MLNALLRLLLPVLTSRTARAIFRLSPKGLFGWRYATLLAEVQAQLHTTKHTLPTPLDGDDQVVVNWYTQDSFDPDLNYQTLNHVLRGAAHARTAQLLALAAYLIEALGKLPPHQFWTYRVVHSHPTIRSEYSPGSVVTERGFVSSSRNPRNPLPGQAYFTLIGKTGRFIGFLSHFLLEDEVLFAPQTTFKILAADDLADGTSHFIMKEL